MPAVTALRRLGRDRVAVELDGGAWRTLPSDAVLEAGLSVGLPLERTQLRTLARQLRRRHALGVAARAVRGRDLSAAALDARLAAAGVAPSDRIETVTALGRAGLLDDLRVARERARVLAERGYGDAAIRERLERQSLEGEAIEAALAELEPEADRAQQVLRRLGEPRRGAAVLARKGFDPDTIAAVLDLDVADAP